MTLGSNSGLSIGTPSAAPSQGLLVEGVYVGRRNSIYQNSSSTNILNVGRDDDMYGGSNLDGGVFVYGNNKFHISTNSNRRLTVDGGGNVGIATDSPTQGRLVVVADSSAITLALRARTGDDFSQVNFLNNAGNNLNGIIGVQKVGTNGGSMYFFTKPDGGSVSEAMRITASGRVLIGTPPPTESTFQLDVNGTGRFSATWGSSSSNPFLVIERSGGAVSSAIGYDNTNTRMYFGTTTNHSLAFRTNNTDVLTIASTGAATFSSSVTAKGDLFIWGGNAAQAGQITANSAGGGLYFGASGTNQNIRLVPSGTGIVQSLGSFDVQGTGTFSSSVTATAGIFNLNTTDGGFKIVGVNATPPNLAYLANNYFPKFYTRNHNFGITIFDQDSNNVGIQAADLVNGTSAKALIFNPYGGNVLIGTTTDAGDKLQVNGTSKFSLDVAISGSTGLLYSSGQFGFTNTASGGQYGIYTLGTSNPTMFFDHRATGNTGTWAWRSGTGGATTAMTLSNAGAATFSSSVTAASFIPSGSTIPTNGMYLPSANTIAFSTNTTQRISVSSAGEVQLKQSSNSAQNSVIFNTTIQNAMTLNSSGFLILNGTTGSSRITCYGDGYFSGGIQTGNPYGSTSANWLLGRFLTETTSANGSIRVQIGSKYYNIAAEDLGEVPT
jgi:hypothetical protein